MDRRLSDEQLDRAVIRLLAEQGAEFEASGITPAQAAARVGSTPTLAHGPRLVTRSLAMGATLTFAAVAVLALAVGIGVVQLRPATDQVGSAPAPSPSPSPLAWSPASIEQDWPAPVREEPLEDPVIIPFAYGSLDHLDPQGDIESPDMPWIDIVRAEQGGCSNPDGVCVKLAAGAPSGWMVPEEWMVPDDPWIAYGLVFDTDLDGVADVRLGLDRAPAELTPLGGRKAWTPGHVDIRAWKTDLRTGVTEYGEAGDWICQCDFGGDGGLKLYPGSYPTDNHGDDRFALIPGRFYVWASEIQDGRVVATDYAPDTGWLEVGGPVPPTPPSPSPTPAPSARLVATSR